MHHMPTPPPTSRIRLTISVTPEVHETFTRMSQAGSMSVSRAMGDWLQDTLDAATHVAAMLERARSTPRLVAQEMHAYALGLADETVSTLQVMRDREAQTRAARGASAAPGLGSPPPGNTGGKVPQKEKKSRTYEKSAVQRLGKNK